MTAWAKDILVVASRNTPKISMEIGELVATAVDLSMKYVVIEVEAAMVEKPVNMNPELVL